MQSLQNVYTQRKDKIENNYKLITFHSSHKSNSETKKKYYVKGEKKMQ